MKEAVVEDGRSRLTGPREVAMLPVLSAAVLSGRDQRASNLAVHTRVREAIPTVQGPRCCGTRGRGQEQSLGECGEGGREEGSGVWREEERKKEETFWEQWGKEAEDPCAF